MTYLDNNMQAKFKKKRAELQEYCDKKEKEIAMLYMEEDELKRA